MRHGGTDVNHERRFRTAYRDVDALVVGALWDVWRHTHDARMRANIETALARLQAAAQLRLSASHPRRSMTP